MTTDDANGSRSIRLSRLLSYVLRHRPDAIGATLTPDGWIAIDELIARSAAAGTPFARDELLDVVARDDKRRYTLSPDGQRIRAAQGHSIAVTLELPALQPPDVLYHGTATRFVASIMADGLRPQSRQHVHLSANHDTAIKVGQRHGKPVVLRIDAARMHAQGFVFRQADNGVWLTDRVPPDFIAPD